MEWQPEPQGLNELLNLLRDAIRPNNRDQALVHEVISLFILQRKKKSVCILIIWVAIETSII